MENGCAKCVRKLTETFDTTVLVKQRVLLLATSSRELVAPAIVICFVHTLFVKTPLVQRCANSQQSYVQPQHQHTDLSAPHAH